MGPFLFLTVLVLSLGFFGVAADDRSAEAEAEADEQVVAIGQFKHTLTNKDRISDEEVQKTLKNGEAFQIRPQVKELFLQLIRESSKLKRKIGKEAFDEEVRKNTVYVHREDVGRAELTTLNGAHRVRVTDQVTGDSWFFLLINDDRRSEHAQKIRDRQWIMSGRAKKEQRKKELRARLEQEGLRWFEFGERRRVKKDFKRKNYRRLYLPGRDSNFVVLEPQGRKQAVANEEDASSYEIVDHERHPRPFSKMAFGIGSPLKPWWKAYTGALKSTPNWRLGAVCASIQVTLTCALGYGKDWADPDTGVHLLSSLEWEAMALSAFFGGVIGTVAGTYKEWVRLGGETRQWIKLMTIGATFGYIFMYFVQYGGDPTAFFIFRENGSLKTNFVLENGTIIAGGVFAHMYLLLNNIFNQLGKRELYEYAHIRREMRVDQGDHKGGLLKGSSKSDSMMQLLYQIQYLTKIGDLGGFVVPLAIPALALSTNLSLGKILLISSLPMMQLWNIWWTGMRGEIAKDRTKPLWEEQNRRAIRRFWMLSGLPLMPLKITHDLFAQTPGTLGAKLGKMGSNCLGRLKALSSSSFSPYRPFF